MDFKSDQAIPAFVISTKIRFIQCIRLYHPAYHFCHGLGSRLETNLPKSLNMPGYTCCQITLGGYDVHHVSGYNTSFCQQDYHPVFWHLYIISASAISQPRGYFQRYQYRSGCCLLLLISYFQLPAVS